MNIKPGSYSKVCPLGVIDLKNVFHVWTGTFHNLILQKQLNQR